MIHLKKVDSTNWEHVIKLRVREEQESFVASNLYSLAQVQFLPSFKAMGVYLYEQIVGFAMYGVDPDDGNYWIYRLMIDKAYQGKGYGTSALEKVVEDIKKENEAGIPYIMIGYEPANQVAKEVYKKAGFEETEIASWGEQLAKLKLETDKHEINTSIVDASAEHIQQYTEMALDLWPESSEEELHQSFRGILKSDRDKILFYKEQDEFVSFIHLSIRVDYVEGTESSPAGYIEGVYVKSEHRRKGYSKKLLEIGEQWLIEKGCSQIGSDIHLDNQVSHAFHTSIGFKEAARLIAFIKDIE
jgi:GNAT superfamily N-acetyltransferase